MGFEYSSYGVRLPLPVSNQRFVLYSNYPAAWETAYVSRNYFQVDPTVQHGLTRTEPLVWASSRLKLKKNEFWEEAEQHQLSQGWCMPVRGLRGDVGMMSFVRSGEQIEQSELDAKEVRMSYLTHAVQGSINSLLMARYVPESRQELTVREREVMRWTAAGKTYSEIGMILAIDERTVKFHIKNSMTKLNAVNKTDAAVKMVKLGLLG